jgi:hypothetical protein
VQLPPTVREGWQYSITPQLVVGDDPSGAVADVPLRVSHTMACTVRVRARRSVGRGAWVGGGAGGGVAFASRTGKGSASTT